MRWPDYLVIYRAACRGTKRWARNLIAKMPTGLPRGILLTMALYFQASTGHASTSLGDEPPYIGNFALPSSQQPTSLISFGQNILDKGLTQIFVFADDFVGENKYNIDLFPNVVYGVTDKLSINVNVPYAVSYKQQQSRSSGWEDAFVQLEYAVYAQKKRDHIDQATVVTSLSIPTGSDSAQPTTGIGAPSFFIGTTYSRMCVYWYMFTSYGATLTTPHGDTQFGNSFLYQAGIGRNIFNIHSRWMFNWLVEADGQYTQRNRIDGMTDPNSGGNVIYITPSLWVSSKKLIFQLGAGIAALQHLNGNQERNYYLIAANLGWTI